MSENNEPLSPKLLMEINKLSEKGISCSAELFIQAAFENYGEFKTDPGFKAAPVTDKGVYILSRTPFAGEGQIDHSIDKFKELLADEQNTGSSASDMLFKRWASIESSLTEEEHKKLHTKLIEKFFSNKTGEITISRGTVETLGGH